MRTRDTESSYKDPTVLESNGLALSDIALAWAKTKERKKYHWFKKKEFPGVGIVASPMTTQTFVVCF